MSTTDSDQDDVSDENEMAQLYSLPLQLPPNEGGTVETSVLRPERPGRGGHRSSNHPSAPRKCSACHQLGHTVRKCPTQPQVDREDTPSKRKRKAGWKTDLSRLEGHHHPKFIRTNKVTGARALLGLCVACSLRESSIQCVECRAFLHIDGEGQENCWWRFHNLQDFCVPTANNGSSSHAQALAVANNLNAMSNQVLSQANVMSSSSSSSSSSSTFPCNPSASPSSLPLPTAAPRQQQNFPNTHNLVSNCTHLATSSMILPSLTGAGASSSSSSSALVSGNVTRSVAAVTDAMMSVTAALPETDASTSV